MTPDQFDAKAFAAKALSVHRAFEHACVRCALHLRNASACPPGDPMRVPRLTRAREEVRTARLAIHEGDALFAGQHSAQRPPPDRAFEAIVTEIETQIDSLSPALDA